MVALAERTEGLSGSDLKELCRNAAMLPMREMLREVGDNTDELARLHKEVRLSELTGVGILMLYHIGSLLATALLGRLFPGRCNQPSSTSV